MVVFINQTEPVPHQLVDAHKTDRRSSNTVTGLQPNLRRECDVHRLDIRPIREYLVNVEISRIDARVGA